MAERIYLYDTTLRDGGQTHGVDFTTADKVAIAQLLDQLGVDYVEAGWPGANPTDDGFFADPPALRRAKLCAFGMTRRAGRSAANDPGLAALFQSRADAITLVGKSSAKQVEVALGVALDENLRMIEDSVARSVPACGRSAVRRRALLRRVRGRSGLRARLPRGGPAGRGALDRAVRHQRRPPAARDREHGRAGRTARSRRTSSASTPTTIPGTRSPTRSPRCAPARARRRAR